LAPSKQTSAGIHHNNVDDPVLIQTSIQNLVLE